MSKLERLVLVREERERGIVPDRGKMMPHFQRCGFPLKKPSTDYFVHDRHDGDVKTAIVADPRYGMPFGADVLTLLWCFTTALDRNNRKLKFRAAAEILHDMGLPLESYNYRAIVKSFERIFGCKYTFEWWEVVPGKGKKRHLAQAVLFDSLSLWFHENDAQMPLEGEGFENEIVLSQFAWKWLHRTSWFATAPAYALRQSPGAIQLYFVIAARAPRLNGPSDCCEIPVTGPEGLDKQIGGVEYGNQRMWRKRLQGWLDQIKTAWPDCPATLVQRDGQERHGWYLQIGYCPQPKG